MLKTLFLLAAGASLLVTGRVTYSAVQQQLFSGTAMKTTPDPSNVWSFDSSTATKNGSVTLPVLIDFDGNQRMDTELKGARVFITDVQLVVSQGKGILVLKDSKGPRWELHTPPNELSVDKTFGSPLVLPVGSKLEVEVKSSAPFVTVHLLGRIVTL